MPERVKPVRMLDNPRSVLRGAFQALLCSMLLLCATASLASAQADRASIGSAPVFPPLGVERGASRKAWAAAAALSRGVNLAVFAAPREGDWGLRMDEQWIETLAKAGFRSVRLSVRWSNHASAGPQAVLDEAFARRIDRVVEALLANDLRVVMNMSFYSQLNGWALHEGETPVAAAVVRTRFVNIWRQLAQRHAHRSDRLLFELYNAPQGNAQEWNRLAAVTVAVIRQSNPSRIIVIAPMRNDAANLPYLSLPRDAHLMVTIHNREPQTFTSQGSPWFAGSEEWLGTPCCNERQRLELARNLDRAKAWSDVHRYPVWLGSFGAASTAPMDSRARYLRQMRDAAEARGMSWSHADFAANFNVQDPPLDSGIYDVVKRQWHRSLLDALLGP
ncbi:hypothetical protein ASE52_04545 [Acidovorax sp. Root275]|nr:hypothetical protein ASE52_04545 [Acidovorax sp. Root275]